MATKKKTLVVEDQPGMLPSRKMEGVAAAFPIGSAAGAIIVWALGPDGAQYNIPDNIELAIMSLCTGAAMFLAGYVRRERAVVVEDA